MPAFFENVPAVGGFAAGAAIIGSEALGHRTATANRLGYQPRAGLEDLPLAGVGFMLAEASICLASNEAHAASDTAWMKLYQPSFPYGSFGEGIETALSDRHCRQEEGVDLVGACDFRNQARKSGDPSTTSATHLPTMAGMDGAALWTAPDRESRVQGTRQSTRSFIVQNRCRRLGGLCCCGFSES